MARRQFSGKQLKTMRLQAGFTQQQLAKRLGISRETLSAIENEQPNAIHALKVELVTRWWHACRVLLPAESRTSFKAYLKAFFGLD